MKGKNCKMRIEQVQGETFQNIPLKIELVLSDGTKKYEDLILNEDVLNTYTFAQPLEMYLENVDGFGGDGELLTKFGLEIRDTATFIVSRRRWDNVIGQFGDTILTNRPAEGDIIYFPLTKSIFSGGSTLCIQIIL